MIRPPPTPQGNTRTAICRTDSNSPSRQDLPEAILLSLQSGDLGFINEAEQDIAINIRQPAALPGKKMLSVAPGTKAISPERLLSPLPFRLTTPEVPPPEAVATPPHNRTPPGASPPHPAALAVASQRLQRLQLGGFFRRQPDGKCRYFLATHGRTPFLTLGKCSPVPSEAVSAVERSVPSGVAASFRFIRSALSKASAYVAQLRKATPAEAS